MPLTPDELLMLAYEIGRRYFQQTGEYLVVGNVREVQQELAALSPAAAPHLTTDELAKRLGVSTETIRRYAEQGVAGQRVGRQWLFCEEDEDRIRAARQPVGRRPLQS